MGGKMHAYPKSFMSFFIKMLRMHRASEPMKHPIGENINIS